MPTGTRAIVTQDNELYNSMVSLAMGVVIKEKSEKI